MSRKMDDYFACKGGLDLATPPIEIPPGVVEFAQNWEVERNGYGYREHEGCERFDGQPLASSGPVTLNDGSGNSVVLTPDDLRAAIQPVPGSGPVRGVWVFEGEVYAFRDTADGTACRMYLATPSGWQQVTTPTLQPGGRYEFCNYNFYASASKKAMYGVDGVNPAFSFDGTTFTQIASGVTPDAPTRVAAYNMHLFLGFPQGSVVHSPPGDPTGTYSAINGAGELGLGDGVTAMAPLSNDVMAIYGTETIHLLYGSSAADFSLKTHAFDSGAYPGTVQPVKGHLMLGPLGVRSLKAVQAYGDFAADVLSGRVTDWLAHREAAVVGSLVARRKNHYRLYFDEGLGTSELSGSFAGRGLALMTSFYPFKLRCFAAGRVNGEEWLLAGADDGFVYRLDSGNSWDGQAMSTILRLPFNHEKTPNIRKHFRECVPEIKAVGGQRAIQLGYSLEFADRQYPQGMTNDVTPLKKGGYWGIDNWGTFDWGGGGKAPVPVKTPGSGTNIALVFSTTRAGDPPVTLSGIRLYYELRRHA